MTLLTLTSSMCYLSSYVAFINSSSSSSSSCRALCVHQFGSTSSQPMMSTLFLVSGPLLAVEGVSDGVDIHRSLLYGLNGENSVIYLDIEKDASGFVRIVRH